MSRVSRTQLLAIADGISDVEREVIELVARLRIISQAQLLTLVGPRFGGAPASAARLTRRTLRRLHNAHVLGRLARRIGGVRAGSSGHVYYLGPVGQRLLAYWNGEGLVRGRRISEPGAAFVEHRLAITQLYVEAATAERAGELSLLAFDVESDCWRSSIDGYGSRSVLKPDAFLRLGLGAYEDRWFVEVDLGTESRTVIRRKAQAYIDYYLSGTEQTSHGVFPRVLLLTRDEHRRAALINVCESLPPEYWQLFAVTTLDRGLALVLDHLANEAHDDAGGQS